MIKEAIIKLSKKQDLAYAEADVDLFQDLCTAFRRQCNLHSQCFQNICCTGFGGCCPVSMFCNRNTACCDHQRRSSGNIEGIRTVSAGTHDFKHIQVVEKFDTVSSHSCCGSRSCNGRDYERSGNTCTDVCLSYCISFKRRDN